jgi:hypothetical protein
MLFGPLSDFFMRFHAFGFRIEDEGWGEGVDRIYVMEYAFFSCHYEIPL